VIAGGRSAGAQVACRTATRLGARAVLALAYPLLGPGSPRELLATDRPTLVIQGGSDPFGRPDQFPALPPEIELVEIPSANHTFGTSNGTPPCRVDGPRHHRGHRVDREAAPRAGHRRTRLTGGGSDPGDSTEVAGDGFGVV
jgi:dienelactone hydrolase